MAYQQQPGLQTTGQMDQQTVSALRIVHGSGQDTHSPGGTTGQGGAGTPWLTTGKQQQLARNDAARAGGDSCLVGEVGSHRCVRTSEPRRRKEEAYS